MSNIANSTMKLLQRNGKVDDREVIRDFLVSEAGAVTLTKHQEELKSRWQEADRLMRSGQYTKNEVYNLLCKTFNYSLATAKRDVSDMQYVFCSTYNDSKPYLLALHIDLIKELIQKAQTAGKWDIVTKLIDSYTKAIKEMPDTSKNNTTPAVLLFNFTTEVAKDLAGGVTEQNAEQVAKQTLGEDFIDFEELT